MTAAANLIAFGAVVLAIVIMITGWAVFVAWLIEIAARRMCAHSDDHEMIQGNPQ